MAQGKVQLNTTKVIVPLDYNPERHFDPTKMAKSLAHICRFAGNVRVFYSVLQHTLLVSNIATEIYRERRDSGENENIDYFEVALMGLLHEAFEQVIGDIPGPVKDLPELRFIKMAENKKLKDLYELHGLSTNLDQLRIVADADKYALSMEAHAFMYEHEVWNDLMEKYPPAKYTQFELTEDSVNFDKWVRLWTDRYIDLVEKRRRIKDGNI